MIYSLSVILNEILFARLIYGTDENLLAYLDVTGSRQLFRIDSEHQILIVFGIGILVAVFS